MDSLAVSAGHAFSPMGQGESYEAALADAKSAAQFHIESFGTEAFDDDSDVEAAYIAEGDIAVA